MTAAVACPLTLLVDGVVCQGCVTTLKRALMAVAGVEHAAPRLHSKELTVLGTAPV